MKKLISFLMLLGLCRVIFALPVQVTSGTLCEPPTLDSNAFVRTAPLESLAVPLEGWKVVWPDSNPDAVKTFSSGIEAYATNAVVRDALLPVLRIELTKGTYSGREPVLELEMPVNAETHNILSFVAKVEVPEGLRPLIGDSKQLIYGWFSSKFNTFFDDFGIAVDDACFQWAACGVPTTHFKYHDFPASRTEDGFTDFAWDMKYGDHTGNKGFARDRARALRFYYDTRKIPEGKKVVVTIALPKLVKGAHIAFDEPELYREWTDFVANYKPDYSDSSKELLPPEEGRIAKPLRITENGKPKAEIIVDLSDEILIDNYFTDKSKWTLEVRQLRGYEVDVARLAARELSRWLREVTTAEIPILLEPTDARNVKIFLGASFARKHFAKDIQFLASGGSSDGFAVREKDGNIYIFGAMPAGTLNGVYSFVENNTDLIWAIADEEYGTVYTEKKTLDVVWANALCKPALAQRGCSGDRAGWRRRNRMNCMQRGNDEGGITLHGGHYLSPQYYDFSEGIRRFNPMINGSTNRVARWSEYHSLACLRHPEFFEHVIDSVPRLNLLRYSSPFECVFGVDDNYGVCECPYCRAPITAADGSILTPEKDLVDFYGAWFYDYLNRLDDAIQKKCPGYMTSTFGYFFASPYPKIKVNKNIVPWLCTYVRKSQNEPIFAPANEHWWKCYKDWAAHTGDLMLYDYYNLGFILKPHAEVYKFDVKAQTSIGFIRNYSEGFGNVETLGVADERWCMAQLAWDPDQDVEKLHRRFNRRTYREAAPYIDKFRGVIRENFYKRLNRSIEFEENYDLVYFINDIGLEDELLGYLEEARKAVKHPVSKVLVERMYADFRFYMKMEGQRDWPSQKITGLTESEREAKEFFDGFWRANERGKLPTAVRPLFWRELAHGSGFTLNVAYENNAQDMIALSFEVPERLFETTGFPVVSLQGNDAAKCEVLWRKTVANEYTCYVRAPADVKKVSGFKFSLSKDAPIWQGTVPIAVLDARKVASSAGEGAVVASTPIVSARGIEELLRAVAEKDYAVVGAMITNAPSEAARFYAATTMALSCGKLRSAYESLRGKVDSCGYLFALQLQALVRELMKAEEYEEALVWLDEQAKFLKPSGDAASEDDLVEKRTFCLFKSKGVAAVKKMLDELEKTTDYNAQFQARRSVLSGLMNAGIKDRAFVDGLLRRTMGNRLVSDAISSRFLIDFLTCYIRTFDVDAKQLAQLYRELYHDGFARANGYSTKFASYGSSDFMRRIPQAFFEAGKYEDAARTYEIKAAWDGPTTPIDFQFDALNDQLKFIRGKIGAADSILRRLRADAKAPHEKLAAAESNLNRLAAIEKKVLPKWRETALECQKNGANSQARGNAAFSLLREDWERKTQKQRLDGLDSFIKDKFMHCALRRRATIMLAEAYSTPDSTNWNAIASHVVGALAEGDWSMLARNTYSRNSKNDLRLEALCAVASKAIEAGELDIAKSLLERGASVLGYTKDFSKKDEPGTSEANIKFRLETLDAMMQKCGASRK